MVSNVWMDKHTQKKSLLNMKVVCNNAKRIYNPFAEIGGRCRKVSDK